MKTFRVFSVSMLALVFGIASTGVSFARTPPQGNGKVEMAVVEFSPGPNAPGMTFEAKRQMQATTAYLLAQTNRFHVVDVRWTRSVSQADQATINGSPSTAAAVKVGKQLRVSYILIGTVEEYTPQGGDGYGRLVLKHRLVEVATGKVKHSGVTTQRSTAAMRTSNAAEMQTRTVKPALEQLTATIAQLSF